VQEAAGTGGSVLIKADVHVQTGEVRFAGVSANLSEVVSAEVVLSARQGKQEGELEIESPERCGWIVFRNGLADGPSRFEIRGLAAFTERNDSEEELREGSPDEAPAT
jgi:hypothetical protein